MKKIILLLAFTPCFFQSMAQLEEIKDKTQWTTVGELKWMGITKAQLAYNAQGKDTAYWLFLKDETTLKSSNGRSVNKHYSIHFNNSGNALGNLKKMLFSFFEKENLKNKDYDKTFHLGNVTVVVQHYRKLTANTIMFYTKEGHTVFNKRELAKLFGKQED
jgi:hypothetical protein